MNFKKNKFYSIGLLFFYVGTFLLPTALAISIILFLISSVIGVINQRRYIFNDKWNKSFLLIAGLMILSNIINLISIDTSYNYNLTKNSDWIDLFNWLPLFFCFIGFQSYLRTPKNRKIFGLILVSGTIPVLFTGFAQYFFNFTPGLMTTFFGLITWYQGEVIAKNGLSGLFSNPNYASSWLNIVLPFCFAATLKTKYLMEKFIVILIFICLFLSIILTNSRAGIGIMLISILLISDWKKIKNTLFFVSFIFIGQFSSLIPKLLRNLKSIINGNPNIQLFNLPDFSSQESGITRIFIWKNGINSILENPIFGSGADSFRSKIFYEKGLNIAHSHNLPMEIAINYGIPISLLLCTTVLLIAIISFKKIYLEHNNLYGDNIFEMAWVSSLITLITGNLVDIQYFDGRISIAGWILLSGLSNVIRKEI